MKLLARAVLGDGCRFGEVAGDRFLVLEGDVFGEPRRNGRSLPRKDLALGPPLAGVRLVNVMGGFLEPGTTRPPERQPLWLPKAVNSAGGDGAEIVCPSILTGPMQIESELAVVVGRPLSKASPAEARQAIFGWTVFNDLTAPEYGALGFWAVGKSIDGFASWGPWIRRDLTEERVMEGLAITATVNGVRVQSGNTRYFCFSPSEMLSHISHRISLFPGDTVALGTPPPAADVAVGDHVACEVEEIGVLHNHIVAEP
ncbi:fumarylacetoacetate hydrolase family protein [Actinomadura rugatobispora]|uniref:Fumarylacetoacetate hydrolase family protein n=1 Tax=Actinomadura rugatobispora TaxID=1994 RepID=A0ABW0ZY77_9ACTN|nr:fumarylacetoacetate hydrolase family protein [Actinomadura rugatobispora]